MLGAAMAEPERSALYWIRRSRGWSVARLMRASGLPETTVRRLEAGATRDARLGVCVRLALALGEDVSAVFPEVVVRERQALAEDTPAPVDLRAEAETAVERLLDGAAR